MTYLLGESLLLLLLLRSSPPFASLLPSFLYRPPALYLPVPAAAAADRARDPRCSVLESQGPLHTPYFGRTAPGTTTIPPPPPLRQPFPPHPHIPTCFSSHTTAPTGLPVSSSLFACRPGAAGQGHYNAAERTFTGHVQ